MRINGGSNLSAFDGKKTTIFGCDKPECNKYFLQQKETMEDESSLDQQSEKKVFMLHSAKATRILVSETNSGFLLEVEINGKITLTKIFDCDSLTVDPNVKFGQAFNLLMTYSDQYKIPFRKIVIPVFYENNEFRISKIFVSTRNVSAKTGNEEWVKKEIQKSISLKDLNLQAVIEKL